MANVWHQSISAYEVYGSRQENWNDVNPSISVVVEVANESVDQFVHDIIEGKNVFPECNNATSSMPKWAYLYANNAEILPLGNKYYDGSASTSEYMVRVAPGTSLVRLSYGPLTEVLRLVTTDIDWLGTGLGSSGSGGAYPTERQYVWVSYGVQVITEFLTMDYNDFQWYYSVGGNMEWEPLKPDEAPGRVMRSCKYTTTFKNIFPTTSIWKIINEYSGTVNNSLLVYRGGNVSFQPAQVLFNVEDVQPSQTMYSAIAGGAALHYNIKVSFTCRTGDGTWNKFWRARREVASTNNINDAGWKQIYLKKVDGINSILFEPMIQTNEWYPLWV